MIKRITTIFLLLSMVAGLCHTSLAADTDLKESDYPASYAKMSNATGRCVWQLSNPKPDASASSAAGGSTVIVNDGSEELPAEAYHAFGELKGGIASVLFDFSMDREMDGTSFRLLGNRQTVFGIVVQGRGIYLEQPGGENIYLCNYQTSSSESRPKYIVKAILDMDKKKVLSVQINGKTFAEDKPFVNEIDYANAFSVLTEEETIGVAQMTGLYIDRGYIVKDMFWNDAANISDDWEIDSNGGFAVISNGSSTITYNSFLEIDSRNGDVLLEKSFESVSGKLTMEANVLLEHNRGGFELRIMSGGEKQICLTSDGTSFCYVDENGSLIPFYSFTKNVWYNLEVHLDTETGLYDIDLNNRPILSGKKLIGNAGSIDSIEIFSEKNDTSLNVDDLLFYRTRPYAEDYPVINDIPEKRDGAPLVGIQFCPMWIQGNHFGWDWIKQASNRRTPVMGYYDGDSPEQADWVIKYMLEHGADYMSICVFPHNAPGADKNGQITDKNLRSNGFLSAVQNSRYRDKIKYSIFLEANGITDGYSYYEKFFNVVLPHYIEHYFKDPSYLKVDGRPVFGVYAVSNFLNVFDDGRGQESIREGIQRIRQVCIDAGVGNPYLIANDNNWNNLVNASNVGLDAVSAYGLGVGTTFTAQKTANKNALDNCISNGIDFIPAAVPMRDDTAWRVATGNWHTKEEFEEMLTWMKDDLLAGYKPSVSTVLSNMATWDEFGEGHIICPTEGMGFSYLDAIRDAFTTGGEHVDEIPTQAQKERITRLYDQEKKIANVGYEIASVDYKIFYESREKDIPEKIPSDVKKGWYMKNTGDAAKISAVSDVSSVKTTAEGIEVAPSGTRPRIKINEFEGIDVYDVTYIKIKMKKNPTSGGGYAYWGGDIVGGISNDNMQFFNAGTENDTEFRDYFIPVAAKTTWTGKIDHLEFTLGEISDLTTPFVIESIELLQDTELTEKDTLIVDSRIQSLTDGIVTDGADIMLPLKEVFYMAGAEEILSLPSSCTYTVKYNDTISTVTAGKRTATVNGEEVSLQKPVYMKSEIVNDTMYVPLQFAEAVFTDKEISWNEDERTFTINSIEAVEDIGREEIYRIDYDDESSIGNPIGLGSISFSDGKMTATTTSSDPNYTVAINQQAEDIKLIQVKINTNAAQQFKYYFITNNDMRWNEAKGSAIVTTKSGENTLLFDTAMVPTWKDTITSFRIDPATASGQTFTIDSVVFYGEEQASFADGGKVKDMSSCVQISENRYEWNFNKNTELDGWKFGKSFGDIKINSGKLSATITGGDPAFINYGSIDINTDEISSINIKYKNKTNSRKLKVYFVTDRKREYAEDSCFEIEVAPMSDSFVEYKINTDGNAAWNGILKNLVVVIDTEIPIDAAIKERGGIEIDSIGLLLKGEVIQ